MADLDLILSRIHEGLAKDMLSRIENGVPDGTDPDTGEVRYRALTAAEWTAIAKFLKDNGIDANPSKRGDADKADAFSELVAAAQRSIAARKALL